MRTKEEIVNAIIEYFKDNEDIFNECIGELDWWNGYLGDDKMYPMDELDELLFHFKPLDLLRLAFNGDFNPNGEYFYFNGYGNLMSSWELDYSDHCDEYFVEALLENRAHIDAIVDNEELSALFDELEEVDEWLYYLQFSLYWDLLWNFTKIIERIWKNEQ